MAFAVVHSRALRGLEAPAVTVDAARLEAYEFAGELSLGGGLRPVHGALAVGLARHRGATSVERARTPPWCCRRRAPTRRPRWAASRCAARRTCSTWCAPCCPATPPMRAGCARLCPAAPPSLPDLRDVKGQAGARRALEIAAAGELSLLMVGPPRTGKSMLAQRLGGLLPELSHEAALESAAILGVAGAFNAARWGQRVLRAPHHTASAAALVGGGSPPRPGEASLAHHGVPFLDELPEFPRAALEALREPLMHCRLVRALQRDAPDVIKRIGIPARCREPLFGDRNRPTDRRPQRRVVSARLASACAMALRWAQSRI
jgi:magnesium chelatase family protein